MLRGESISSVSSPIAISMRDSAGIIDVEPDSLRWRGRLPDEFNVSPDYSLTMVGSNPFDIPIHADGHSILLSRRECQRNTFISRARKVVKLRTRGNSRQGRAS
jgi:hypothetical protein